MEILDIPQIFDHETAKFLFKVKNNLLPCSIGNYFPMREYADNHEFNHERPPKIVCRLVSSEKSLQHRQIELWNSIPKKSNPVLLSILQKNKKTVQISPFEAIQWLSSIFFSSIFVLYPYIVWLTKSSAFAQVLPLLLEVDYYNNVYW